MEKRTNRRRVTEHFLRGRHLKLNDLKIEAQSVGNGYLFTENIPEYPRPEFHVFHLKHDTDEPGLHGIKQDQGFRSMDEDCLVWWSLAVGPEDITSAEGRLLETTYPDRTDEQARMQRSFLGKFATSPAFLETSRLGSYRFTFPLEEVLEAYSEQFCQGAQPLMQVFETVLYKQEVMYVVLVDRPENAAQYPLLSDDPTAVCAYEDGHFIWRPEAMCNTHSYELVRRPDENQLEVTEVSPPHYYVWDNVAIALRVEEGQVLSFDDDKLRKNLRFCEKGKPALSGHFNSFQDAEELAGRLWRDSSDPLEKQRSLQLQWSGGQFSSISSFKVPEGGVASLSCQYSVKRFGLSRVCWGRGCGTFWCSNILVQMDEDGVVSKVGDRYRLTGDVLDGQMDLDILDVRRTDSGPYCCRVDIDGIFNDKKVIMNLRVVKAPVTSSPPSTATTKTTTDRVTEPSASTGHWKTLQPSQLDRLRRNSTLLRSDTVTVEDSLPSLSLQINVPVLSLSLSVLLILAAVFLFLAFRRGIYRRALKTGCFSSEEPPHIIYEIRMRRPVQENIYTLD
ncbi:uncharacterized protein LOC121190253 isoform X2 [Toxotes jaculatrix]|uniref:uncharacterized protein LOC121190253 isoform X2 n=1 Tax=Toxotes jaculatrix TaxID=941984 RepID=UPI001B3A7D74|nr:uncharacterized protein LOC121190253 isoform X2 [Toxotes jaculatrix]